MTRPIRLALPLLVVALLIPVSLAEASHNKKRNWHLGDRAPLKVNHRGQDIRVLQDYLTRAGHRTRVDGHFGRATGRSVRAFQRAEGRRVITRMSKWDIKALRRAVERRRGSTRAQAAPPAPGSVAKLGDDGLAVAPADAPEQVKQIIEAANRIALKPYRYGGGHGKWEDSGYDCSGSVSYALRGAGLVERPMASGGYRRWGEAGRGQWVTVYAHSGHMYMEVAGLRFDTSARRENGSRWSARPRSAKGYSIRRPPGL